MKDDRAPFYPPDAPAPEVLQTDEFLLRPLRATDVELDYEAVMVTKARLRVRMGGTWPRDGFTLEENLDDLQRHERDFVDRAGFTYTVVHPREPVCLGCVYAYPLASVLRTVGVDDAIADEASNGDANVSFWVREDRVADGLDERLLAALGPWFRNEFAFRRVVYGVFDNDDRQLAVLRGEGLLPEGAYPALGAEFLLFE